MPATMPATEFEASLDQLLAHIDFERLTPVTKEVPAPKVLPQSGLPQVIQKATMPLPLPSDVSAQILRGAGPFHLQAELHTFDKVAFAAKYREITGKNPVVFPRKSRGVSAAIYFCGNGKDVANLKAMGYDVKDFHSGEFTHCIESERFFWKMVQNGFRL